MNEWGFNLDESLVALGKSATYYKYKKSVRPFRKSSRQDTFPPLLLIRQHEDRLDKMAFDFHSDRNKYFMIQWHNSRETILPLVQQYIEVTPTTKVLEIGCREGGVLMPFYEKGCYITGLDVNQPSLERAKQHFDPSRSKFIHEDIHNYVIRKEAKEFDVILIKDTIEHIPDQEKLISNLKNILTEKGIIYFGFPPWQNPYGGHQQVCKNKLCAIIPYYHLLPNFIYLNIIKKLSPRDYTFLKKTKDTRITPEKFERFVQQADLKILYKQFYLMSPIYKHKFNLKPRKQFRLIASIPYFRNFVTTTCDYIMTKDRHLLSDRNRSNGKDQSKLLLSGEPRRLPLRVNFPALLRQGSGRDYARDIGEIYAMQSFPWNGDASTIELTLTKHSKS